MAGALLFSKTHQGCIATFKGSASRKNESSMVSHISVTRKKPQDLHIDKLPRVTRKAFLYCAGHLDLLVNSMWYLAGGTALALQVGHRQSVDLDFFLPKVSFDRIDLERKLLATGQWVTSFIQEGTLYGVLTNARVSFIAYPFFKPSLKRIQCRNVFMLIPSDIAAMKIIAISQRGRKRDFVDLYWYCINKDSLPEVIKRAIRGYPGQEDNINHILRSLVYFADAEEDPMPKIFFDASWRVIKEYFRKEVPRITKEFLGLV